MDSMRELVFAVTQQTDAVRDAGAAYHFDRTPPTSIRLHLVRDEILLLA